MSAIAAPADRRFRRAHIKPTRHRRVRAVVRPLVRAAVAALVVSFVAYRAGSAVAHAHALQVDRIVVTGNHRLSSGEVLAVLDGLRGQNLVWTDLDEWRQRLLASPWVKDASLRRSLPSTIEVMVTERSPIAIGRIDGRLYLIDDRGLVIDQYGVEYADLDLPIVDGLSVVAGEDGDSPDEPRAELAARVISAIAEKPELAKRLSQVDVSDVHNAAIVLAGDSALIYVGEDRFLSRLETYEDLASALRERVPDIDYVDLRFDDRIYVRPVAAPGHGAQGRPAKKP